MSGRHGATLVLALVVALGVRLAAHQQMAAAADTFAPVVDSEAYLLQALRVAAGEDIVEGVYFQAPLYPWLLGVAFRLANVPGTAAAEHLAEIEPETLAHALAVGRGLNLAAGLLLVWLLARVGQRLFSPGVGLAAAALAAVAAPLVFYEGHLLKVSLSLLFLPWAVLAAARALRKDAPGAFFWTGLALGLGGLVRGNMHLLAGLAMVLVVVAGARRRRWSWGLRSAIAIAVGVALALAPVVARNSIVAGRPVLSTAAGGTAFYLCNHAGNTTGLVEHIATNRQVPRYELDDWKQRAEAAVGRELTPSEISDYWMDRALEEIAADPGRWLLAELRKLGLLFSRYEAPDNVMFDLGAEEAPLLAALPVRYGLVLPLAFAGTWLAFAWRRRDRGGPGRTALAAAALGYGATLLLFNVTSRFRMPVEPLAMIPAAYLLARLGALAGPDATGRLRAAVVLALAAGFGASLVSEGPLGPLDAAELASHRAVRYKNRADVALSRGDGAAARADLERAIAATADLGRGSPDIFVRLGYLERAEALARELDGRRDEAAPFRGRAVEATRAALRLNPGHGPGHRLAGLLLYDEGAHADAVASFDRALAAVPLDREARQYRALSQLSLGRTDLALADAEALVAAAPDHDDGYGLLALSRLRLGDREGALAALRDYDRLAAEREALGLVRRLPDLAELAQLRAER